MNKKLNTYEQKKADKVERLREAADKLDAQADRMAENYSSMAVHLPVGQPVLKGQNKVSHRFFRIVRMFLPSS